MHETLLSDLTVILLTAGVVTILCRMLHQPVVLGYLVAGMLVGPHTPPYGLVQDEHAVETLAELGVIMLMFSLGLHFSIRKLFKVGSSAVSGATAEIILMMALGFGIGSLFGWSSMDSLFLGAILSISSTTIIVKAISEMGKLKERFVDIVFGILIVEDLAAVALLAILSGIAIQGSADVTELTTTLMNLGFFITVVLVLGYLLVPRLLNFIHRFRSDEILTVTALALCYGSALIAHQLGFSVALGAFAMGAIIAESRHGARVEELSGPIRDLFSAVFFVSIGMLIDFQILIEYAVPIAVITVAVIGGKILSCSLGTLVAGNSVRKSLLVGFSLAQIGEFSFIIAALGAKHGATSDFLYPIAVAVSAITTFTTPYLIRWADGIADVATRFLPQPLADTTRLYAKLEPEPEVPHAPVNMMLMVLRRELRRALLQILINIVLIGAFFTGASALGDSLPALDAIFPPAWGGGRAILWTAVLLLSLPLMVAVYRKLQAITMMLAEISVPEHLPNDRKYQLRRLVSRMLLIVLTALLGVAFLLMGASLLPPWPVLVAIGAVLAIVLWRLWGHFVRIYSRAQVTLRETLSDPVDAHRQEAGRALPHLLAGARLSRATVGAGANAVGKMIRELEIRKLSGASVIAIERSDGPVLNPGPHEELRVADVVYLFGTEEQCIAAEALIEGNALPT